MKAVAIQNDDIQEFNVTDKSTPLKATVQSILHDLFLSKNDSASLIESKLQDKARANLNFLWEQFSEKTNISRSAFCKSIGWTTTSNFSAYLKGNLPLGDNVVEKIAHGLEVEPQMIKLDFANSEFKDFLKDKQSREYGLSSDKMKKVAKNIKMMWQVYQGKTGMTQQEFCQSKLGLKTQAGFSQIINGKAPVSNDLLIKLASAFNCAVTDISPEASIDYDSVVITSTNDSEASILIQEMMEMLQGHSVNIPETMRKRIDSVIHS